MKATVCDKCKARRGMGKVSFEGAMGLLDDAIRQHLEFKRMRGADPSEVASEERDALGPETQDADVAPPERPGSRENSSKYGEDHLPAGLGPSPRPGPYVD